MSSRVGAGACCQAAACGAGFACGAGCWAGAAGWAPAGAIFQIWRSLYQRPLYSRLLRLNLVPDLVLAQVLDLILPPGREAGLGGEVAVRILQDELLLGPGAARGVPGLDGKLLGEGSFDFECHILVI